MLISDIFKKRKFDRQVDRIGPDIPFTHWRLYFSHYMLRLCKRKFAYFDDTASFRPGAYAVGCSQIRIGRRVVIRPGTKLFGESPTPGVTITIEDDVMMGSGVQIYINNHRFDRLDISLIDQGHYPPEPVILKKGCWIGANAVLLPGVSIGENTVVGAGSIVTKSFGPGLVVAGNPCKVIRAIPNERE